MQYIYRMVKVASVILLVAPQLWAQSSEYKREQPAKKVDAKSNTKNTKSADENKDSDKLDISDLKKKYWAPKDTDFSVVQNRTYSKNKRYSVSLQYGPVLNDGYNSGFALGLTGNYFFSERHGMELTYVNYDLKNNDVVDSFINDPKNTNDVTPDFSRIKSYFSVGYNWVPVYAKVSLLGKRILYFDLAISPHIGMLQYDTIAKSGNSSNSSIMLGVDITQYYFLSNKIALRFDLRNSWSSQDIVSWQTGQKLRSSTINETTFLLGVTYYH